MSIQQTLQSENNCLSLAIYSGSEHYKQIENGLLTNPSLNELFEKTLYRKEGQVGYNFTYAYELSLKGISKLLEIYQINVSVALTEKDIGDKFSELKIGEQTAFITDAGLLYGYGKTHQVVAVLLDRKDEEIRAFILDHNINFCDREFVKKIIPDKIQLSIRTEKKSYQYSNPAIASTVAIEVCRQFFKYTDLIDQISKSNPDSDEIKQLPNKIKKIRNFHSSLRKTIEFQTIVMGTQTLKEFCNIEQKRELTLTLPP